jgi:cell division protein FtsB
MRWLLVVLALVLVSLQYRMFLSNDGVREVLRLQDAVAAQQSENARLTERNRQLAAEVHDLKQGYAALEERARSDLGMIAGNESFFQVVPQKVPTPASGPLLEVPVEAPKRTALAR